MTGHLERRFPATVKNANVGDTIRYYEQDTPFDRYAGATREHVDLRITHLERNVYMQGGGWGTRFTGFRVNAHEPREFSVTLQHDTPILLLDLAELAELRGEVKRLRGEAA